MPSYHLVASFPEGERPTRAQIEDIEDRLCEAIGLAEHQRVSAVHQNTEHWHLHVAISTVHPTTFRNVSPFRDHWHLQEACAELELKHGLIVTNHTLLRDAGQLRERQEQPKPFLAWVQQEAAAALLEARDAGQGWQHLHGVATAHGLTLKLRGAGLVIGHAQDQRLHVKASAVDRGLSLKALTNALGEFEPAGPTAQAQQSRTIYTRPDQRGPLYAAFERERDEATRARTAAALALREQHRVHAAELAAYYRTRMKAERASALCGALRRDSVQHVARKRREDHAARIAREAEERRQLREAYRLPSWQAWLEDKAAEGSAEAQAALSARRQSVRLAAKEPQTRDPLHAQEIQHGHTRHADRPTRDRGPTSRNDTEHER